MNIVLTGFMGTGKTVIGKSLARNLGWPYVDTDELIEKKAGLKINEVFAKHGEGYFRELEGKAIKSVSDFNNYVIATGGGVVLREENMDNLEKNGFVVNLYASPDVIYNRIKTNDDRPLLNKPNPKNEIERLLEERKPYYKRCNMSINTDDSNIEKIVEKIIQEINKVPEGLP